MIDALARYLMTACLAQVPLIERDSRFIEVVVPTRPDSVVVRLASDTAATVTEARAVQLVQGANRLRFDWSRERIDESSVRFELKPRTGNASITARTKVGRLGGMLYFDVEASEATAATIVARYLLAGLGWRVDYTGLLDGAAEERLALALDVELNNNSGKDLNGARVVFDGGEVDGVVLQQGERREVEVFRLERVPFVKRYLFDPSRFGAAPGIEVELDNEPGSPLERALLPAGRIRVFGASGDGGPALVGEDVLPSTSRGEKARFYLGHARDLLVERNVLSQVNENERRDRWNKVVAYDQRTRVRFKIQDGLKRDVSLTLVERPGAPFEVVSCSVPYEKKKSDLLELKAELKAAQESTVEVEWLRRNLF